MAASSYVLWGSLIYSLWHFNLCIGSVVVFSSYCILEWGWQRFAHCDVRPSYGVKLHAPFSVTWELGLREPPCQVSVATFLIDFLQ